MNRLTQAIILATQTHADQVDKSGLPYILHPLRVMQMGRTEAERVVGVLHDVMEDAADRRKTEAALIRILALAEWTALLLLTREGHHSYPEFIDRIATSGSQLAIRVKLNDLTDNLRPLHRDATRIDMDRVERYHAAMAVLMDARSDI